MRHLRAILRLVLFLGFSTLMYLVALLQTPVRWLAPRLGRRLHDASVLAWARGCCRIIGLTVRVEGRPPTPPFFLVSNHVSYVDIVALMAQVPVVFVAKSEVSRWPFLGRLSRAANTIFVDRGRRADVVRVNELIGGMIRDGRGVLVFPEGTSSRGAEVLPFRSSLLEPAVRIGHPVAAACLAYSTPAGWPAADQSVCWWGDMTFPSHFYRLLQIPRVSATLRFSEAAITAADRHELAERLQQAVAERFTPSSQSAPALAS